MDNVLVQLQQLFPEGQWEISGSPVGESKQAYIAENGQQKLHRYNAFIRR